MVQVTRFFTALSFLLATSATVNALVPRQSGPSCPAAEICGPRSKRSDKLPFPVVERNVQRNRGANAERLARGLPPLKPTRRFTGLHAPRAGPSGTPPTTYSYHGIIKVLDPNNNLLGYISKNSVNNHQQLGYNPDITQALLVDFTVPSNTAITSQVEISTENQDDGYSLLSLVQGRDDSDSTIQPGSYQYGYIDGSDHTAPGATPQLVANPYQAAPSPRTAESSVWSFNPSSSALSPQWINPDGSSPTTYTFVQSQALYFGGDESAFFSRYPAPVTAVTYVFQSV